LKLAVLMVAGELDEVDLADVLGLVSFGVMVGRIPPAAWWVDEMVASREAEVNERFSERYF
jgi:hypothetical protein